MKLGLLAIIPLSAGIIIGVIAFIIGIRALVKIRKSLKEEGEPYSGKVYSYVSIATSVVSIIVGGFMILIVYAVNSAMNLPPANKIESPPVIGRVNEYFFSDPDYNLGPKKTVILPDSTCLTLVYIMSRKDKSGEYLGEYFLLKTNYAGDEILRRKLENRCAAMTYLPEKGIYLTTTHENGGSTDKLLQYSVDCEPVSVYTIDGFDDTVFMSFNLLPCRDGNLFQVGNSSVKSNDVKESGDRFLTALKISPDGKIIWKKNFSISEKELGYQTAECRDGYLISSYISPRNTDPDAEISYPTTFLRLLKLDQNGSLEWEIGTADSIGFRRVDMKVSADESIVFAGVDFSSDSTEGRSAIYKFDKDGNYLFSKFVEPVVSSAEIKDSSLEIPIEPELYGIIPWMDGKWLVCGRIQISDEFVNPLALGARDLKWYMAILDEDFNWTDYFFSKENTVVPFSITRISAGHAVVSCIGGKKEDNELMAKSDTRIGGSVVLLHYMGE